MVSVCSLVVANNFGRQDNLRTGHNSRIDRMQLLQCSYWHISIPSISVRTVANIPLTTRMQGSQVHQMFEAI